MATAAQKVYGMYKLPASPQCSDYAAAIQYYQNKLNTSTDPAWSAAFTTVINDYTARYNGACGGGSGGVSNTPLQTSAIADSVLSGAVVQSGGSPIVGAVPTGGAEPGGAVNLFTQPSATQPGTTSPLATTAGVSATGIPSWVWIAAGVLLVGIVIAVAVKHHKPGAGGAKPPAPKPPTPPTA